MSRQLKTRDEVRAIIHEQGWRVICDRTDSKDAKSRCLWMGVQRKFNYSDVRTKTQRNRVEGELLRALRVHKRDVMGGDWTNETGEEHDELCELIFLVYVQL